MQRENKEAYVKKPSLKTKFSRLLEGIFAGLFEGLFGTRECYCAFLNKKIYRNQFWKMVLEIFRQVPQFLKIFLRFTTLT